MSDLDRYLMLCDPLPASAARAREWRKAVQSVASSILQSQDITSWGMAEMLARIPIEKRLDPDGIGLKARRIIARALPDSADNNDLLWSVCTMCAVIQILESSRANTDRRVSRRNSIAVGLWSALSFQRPLAEERLEDVRTRILNSARRTGLELARRTRTRSTVPIGAPIDRKNFNALRKNAGLDQEEIKVLRWTLADESTLLDRTYADVKCNESVALARGLELGQLLDQFPDFGHCELASRSVSTRHEIDLEGVLEALGEDRSALAAPFEGNSTIEACPNVFPLLTALRDGSTCHSDGSVVRSLADWCGRALLESAIVRRSQSSRGRS